MTGAQPCHTQPQVLRFEAQDIPTSSDMKNKFVCFFTTAQISGTSSCFSSKITVSRIFTVKLFVIVSCKLFLIVTFAFGWVYFLGKIINDSMTVRSRSAFLLLSCGRKTEPTFSSVASSRVHCLMNRTLRPSSRIFPYNPSLPGCLYIILNILEYFSLEILDSMTLFFFSSHFKRKWIIMLQWYRPLWKYFLIISIVFCIIQVNKQRQRILPEMCI